MDPFSFENRILSQRGVQYIIAEMHGYGFRGERQIGEDEVRQLFQDAIPQVIHSATLSSDAACSRLMHELRQRAQNIFLEILDELGETRPYSKDCDDPITRYNLTNLAMLVIIRYQEHIEGGLREKIEANEESCAQFHKICFIWAVDSFWKHLF